MGGPVDLIIDGLLSLDRELAKYHDPARPHWEAPARGS